MMSEVGPESRRKEKGNSFGKPSWKDLPWGARLGRGEAVRGGEGTPPF
jgi:hypothetical protein